MKIDTGTAYEPPTPKSAVVDDTQYIKLTDGVRAERYHRQIIQNIETCETTQDLDTYMEGESLLLDALYLNWPEFSAIVQASHDDHRAMLACDPAPRLAQADPRPTASDNLLGIKF